MDSAQSEEMAAEAILQSRILRYLDTLPYAWYTKIHNTGRGRRGVPDILACVCGLFLSIEVKGPNGRVSEDQNREMIALNRAGANTIVPRTLEEVVEVVADLYDVYQAGPHHQYETVEGTVVDLDG